MPRSINSESYRRGAESPSASVRGSVAGGDRPDLRAIRGAGDLSGRSQRLAGPRKDHGTDCGRGGRRPSRRRIGSPRVGCACKPSGLAAFDLGTPCYTGDTSGTAGGSPPATSPTPSPQTAPTGVPQTDPSQSEDYWVYDRYGRPSRYVRDHRVVRPVRPVAYRPAARPVRPVVYRPAVRPVTYRPVVRRPVTGYPSWRSTVRPAPTVSYPTSPVPPVAWPTPTAATDVPAGASDFPSGSAAADLIGLLDRPELAQALGAMLLGPYGRTTEFPVGDVPVPTGAFTNLLDVLASQAGARLDGDVEAPDEPEAAVVSRRDPVQSTLGRSSEPRRARGCSGTVS